jgi:anti-sigma28 factor (negative regulator of flagellin synthesis)
MKIFNVNHLMQILPEEGLLPVACEPKPVCKTDDGVTLAGMSQIKRMISDLDCDEQVDLERVAQAARQLVDGRYDVPAHDVADAILDQVVFLETLLR